MKLIVTGCGRSGTQYMAAVLNGLGLRASHERVFNAGMRLGQLTEQNIIDNSIERDVEVGWPATAFLAHVPTSIKIYHQIRDPLKVVRCHWRHRLVTGTNTACQFVQHCIPLCRGWTEEEDQFQATVRFVFVWNCLAHIYARKTYRLESLTGELLASMLGEAGLDVSSENSAKVLKETQHISACGHQGDEGVTWERIRKSQHGEDLWHLAHYYGYSY